MGSLSRFVPYTELATIIPALGGLYVVLAVVGVSRDIPAGNPPGELLGDFLLIAAPATTLLYYGYRLPQTDVSTNMYPRITGWCLGGFCAMLCIVGLLVLNPGWSINQPLRAAIVATAFGSVGGYAIGLQEARALARATQAEQQSRKLQRYETLIEQATDVNAVLDSDGTFQYVTPSVEHVLGYQPADLVGEVAFEYMHPADREAVLDAFMEMLEAGGMSRTVVFRFEHADGGWVFLEGRGRNLLEDPVIDGIAAYTHDVTEREQLEDELRRERDLRERIVETTPVGITVVDADGRFSFANEYAGEIVGLPKDKLTGSEYNPSVFEATKPDGGTVEDDIFTQVLATGEPCYNVQRQITRADGRRVGVSVNAAPLRDSSGATTGVVFAFEDTTERQNRKQELKEAVEELEASNDRLERFASMLAHELRNPVNIGQIYTQQLPKGADSEVIDYVVDAFNRIENTIDVMLVLTRGQEVVSNQSTVQLAMVARDAWENMDAADATVEIGVDCTIQADETYIRHLFRNLFENAVEHGGTDVTIEVEELPTGFYVADDGPGVPADDRETVFDAGYTTAAEQGGTGLGLAFIKELADVYKWNCSVTDSALGGAQFEFTNVNQSTQQS